MKELERVIQAFKAEKNGNGWKGVCPVCGHHSLIINRGSSAPVIAWCGGGCDKAEVNRKVYSVAKCKPEPWSLARFCLIKKLPLEWVEANFFVEDVLHGDKNELHAVRFPYLGPVIRSESTDEEGTKTTRLERAFGGYKVRFSEKKAGKRPREIWAKDSYVRGSAPLYGLHRLKEYENLDTVVLVEGESDTITLAYNNITAFGVMGAPHGFTKEVAALPILKLAKRILVVQEPGEAGGALVQKVNAAFPGKTWAVTLPTKDPSELWIQSATPEAFRAAWDKAVISAKLVEEPPEDGGLILRKMSTIEPKAVEWFWPGRIPAKKLSMFVGDPGVGKGLATCDIVAVATTGGTFPDEDFALRDPIDVLMMYSEDDAADTVVPRLMAAGADLSRVYDIPETPLGPNSTRRQRMLAFDTDLDNPNDQTQKFENSKAWREVSKTVRALNPMCQAIEHDGRPKRPKGLGKYGDKEWSRQIKLHEARFTLAAIDGPMLELHCRTYQRYRDALDHIDTHGAFNAEGDESAASKLATKLQGQLRQTLAALAATTTTRDRARKTVPPPEPPSPMSASAQIQEQMEALQREQEEQARERGEQHHDSEAEEESDVDDGTPDSE